LQNRQTTRTRVKNQDAGGLMSVVSGAAHWL
jgi:hypothetical protein